MSITEQDREWMYSLVNCLSDEALDYLHGVLLEIEKRREIIELQERAEAGND